MQKQRKRKKNVLYKHNIIAFSYNNYKKNFQCLEREPLHKIQQKFVQLLFKLMRKSFGKSIELAKIDEFLVKILFTWNNEKYPDNLCRWKPFLTRFWHDFYWLDTVMFKFSHKDKKSEHNESNRKRDKETCHRIKSLDLSKIEFGAVWRYNTLKKVARIKNESKPPFIMNFSNKIIIS